MVLPQPDPVAIAVPSSMSLSVPYVELPTQRIRSSEPGLMARLPLPGLGWPGLRTRASLLGLTARLTPLAVASPRRQHTAATAAQTGALMESWRIEGWTRGARERPPRLASGRVDSPDAGNGPSLIVCLAETESVTHARLVGSEYALRCRRVSHLFEHR